MSSLEKINAAEKAKQMGNDLYKMGKFLRAARKYDKVARVAISKLILAQS